MTKEQALEIMRLANLFARRRVRAYAVIEGHGPNETVEGTKLGVEKAKAALLDYLDSLVPQTLKEPNDG
jgi:hypothetical protein